MPSYVLKILHRFNAFDDAEAREKMSTIPISGEMEAEVTLRREDGQNSKVITSAKLPKEKP